MSSEEGRLLGERYLLRETVGRGGMGVVWRATDTLLDRDVAVKEVRTGTIDDPYERNDVYERTLREARLAARLRHPGIVAVHDVLTADGRPWIVMDLIDGRSLDDVLAAEGRLAPGRAARITLNALDALGAAHATGILHRDVKPANILLLDGDKVVLTDFGIATNPDETRLTRSGQVIGSPGYLAPERIAGRPATAASDIWSLGVTLFAMVEGHGPFDRDDPMAMLGAAATTEAPPAWNAGPLRGAIAAMLDRDPATRMTAEAVERALTAAVTAPSPPPPPPPPLPSPGPPGPVPAPSGAPTTGAPDVRPRSPWPVAGAVAAAVVLLAAGVTYVVRFQPGQGHPAPTSTPRAAARPDVRTPPGIPAWLAGPVPAPAGPLSPYVERYRDPAGRFTIDYPKGCPRTDPVNLIPLKCQSIQFSMSVEIDKIPVTRPEIQIDSYYRDRDRKQTYIAHGGGKFLGFDAASRELSYIGDDKRRAHEYELIVITGKHRYDLTIWAQESGWADTKPDIQQAIRSFRPS